MKSSELDVNLGGYLCGFFSWYSIHFPDIVTAKGWC